MGEDDLLFRPLLPGPKQKQLVFEINRPLAGLIDLLRQVNGTPRFLSASLGTFVLGSYSIRNAHGKSDGGICGIDGGHLEGRILPTHPPLPLEPNILILQPAGRAVIAVDKGAGRLGIAVRDDLFHRHIPLVGPTGKRHPPLRVKEFKESSLIVKLQGERSPMGNLFFGERKTNHLVPRLGSQTLLQSRIAYRLEFGQAEGTTSDQAGLLAIPRTIDHRAALTSPVLFLQKKGFFNRVSTGKQLDHHPCGVLLGSDESNLLPGALQTTKSLLLRGSLLLITSLGRNKQSMFSNCPQPFDS